MRDFFTATRATYGHTALKRWLLVKDKVGILNHYYLNYSIADPRSNLIQSTVFLTHRLEQSLTNCHFLKRFAKNNKASCSDAIPSEIYKHGGEILTHHLHHLFQKIWNAEEITQYLKDAKRVIWLTVATSEVLVSGKILAKVLLNRLQPLSESILPETQCGFQPTRGTADMIFAARQVQEKCLEQRRDLFFAFIDPTKAFDSVYRDALWGYLVRLGCPPKFVSLTRQLQENMKGCVLHDGD